MTKEERNKGIESMPMEKVEAMMRSKLKMEAVQARKPSTKVNKGEEFKKVSNFNRQLIGKPVSHTEYVRVNQQGTLERVHKKVKMTKKQRRKERAISY